MGTSQASLEGKAQSGLVRSQTISVILAAGRGERLKPMSDDLPKGLIRIGDKTLIEHSLVSLASNGIKKAIIVVGYKAAQVERKLGSKYAGIRLAYAVNKEYGTTGSMYSLFIARDLVDEDILLLESDLIFQPNAIDTLIRSDKGNIILVAPCRGDSDEVFIQTDPQGHLTGLGKQLERKKSLGELVGVSKLSLQFLKRLYKRAEAEYEQGCRSLSYEDAIMLTAKEIGTGSVYCIFRENLLWTDVDTESDLKRAKMIFPKMKESDIEASPNSIREDKNEDNHENIFHPHETSKKCTIRP